MIITFQGTIVELIELGARLERGTPPAPPVDLTVVKHHILAGNIIYAIKAHRTLTGATLKDSKDFCEQLRAEMRCKGEI